MDSLVIDIFSFGFRKSAIPQNISEHGGGYVFDCRALPNPGRQPKYQQLTGQDQQVIEYLKKKPQVSQFIENVYGLVRTHAENYRQRNFTSLTVCFGCTGGQHRSVYCAEELKIRLHNAGYKTTLKHIDKPDFA